MPLQIGVYRDRMATSIATNDGLRMLADWTLDARGVQFSTDAHGFGSCSMSVTMPPDQAQRWKNEPRAYRLILSDGPYVAWDGRIEQVTTTDDGISVSALGLFREYEDPTLTALWSSTQFSDWRVATGDDLTNRTSDLFEMDTDGRLYITLVRGNTYLNNTNIGTLLFTKPDTSIQNIERVVFSYEAVLPITTTARLVGSLVGSGTGNTEWSITGTAALQSGTIDVAISPSMPWVHFDVLQTGGGTAPGQETGTWYFKVTSVRVVADPTIPVLASSVVANMASLINSTSTLRDIQTSTIDLADFLYEDQTPLEMIRSLTTRATTTADWAFEVWEDRNVAFRPIVRDDMPVYYVDNAQVQYSRDLDRLTTRMVVTYQDAGEYHNVSRDNTSVLSVKGRDRHGVDRYRHHSASTTDSTQATSEATQILNTHEKIITAGTITFSEVTDERGASIPAWRVRKGCKFVLRRNHIVNYWEDADTVIVGRTSYNVDTGEMSVEPLDMPVTMETAIAAAGPTRNWENGPTRNW